MSDLRELRSQRGRFGLVDTEGFFGQVIAARGIRARATSHTDISELAAATLPCQVIGVAQFVEDFCIGPDICELFLAQVASDRRQIATRENFAFMRHEADTGSCQTSLGHCVHVVRISARMSSGMARRMSSVIARRRRLRSK